MRDIENILSDINDSDDVNKLIEDVQAKEILAEKDGVSPSAVVELDLDAPTQQITSQISDDADHKKSEKKKDDIQYQAAPFTIKGTKSWNTVDPYVIPIDNMLLNDNYYELKNSFYYVSSPADEAGLKENVRTHILKFIRTKTDIITNYDQFIFSIINSTIEEIAHTFPLEANMKDLLIYHLGPNTVFRIIIGKFFQQRFGYCYKMTSANKAEPYIPEEYIKNIVQTWFEQNINNLDLEFDSVQSYEKIKSTVTRQYQAVEKKFNLLHYEVSTKTGVNKNISKDGMLKVIGDKLFGLANIFVYKRFVNKTIFH